MQNLLFSLPKRKFVLLSLSSILALGLSGCVEDPKEPDTVGVGDTETVTDYGVSYSGKTTWAKLDSIDEVQAFLDVFELHHRNQALMAYWPNELAQLTAESDLESYYNQSCSGETSIRFDIAQPSTAETTTETSDSLGMNTPTDSLAEAFDNGLTLDRYCYPDGLWNVATSERGTIRVAGKAEEYTTSYTAYQKNIPGFYELKMGGQVLNKPNAAQPSKTFDVILSENLQAKQTYQYQDFIVSSSSDGVFYTGTVFHPDYGKVFMTTKQGTEHLVVTAEEDVLVNRPTQGTLVLTTADADKNRAEIRFKTTVAGDVTSYLYDLSLDLGSDEVADQQLLDQTWPGY